MSRVVVFNLAEHADSGSCIEWMGVNALAGSDSIEQQPSVTAAIHNALQAQHSLAHDWNGQKILFHTKACMSVHKSSKPAFS